jgi:predicted small integral membrane protein
MMGEATLTRGGYGMFGVKDRSRNVPRWLAAFGSPHTAAVVLTASVALYMALVAFGNITDFGTNQQFVQHVLAMDTTFHDKDLMWRAITSPGLADTAYVLIIAWETLIALVLIGATALWPVARSSARALSTLGLVMTLLLFGAGFLAIGGEWFAMWQSKQWNGLESATRDMLFAGVTLLVVLADRDASGAREDQASHQGRAVPEVPGDPENVTR